MSRSDSEMHPYARWYEVWVYKPRHMGKWAKRALHKARRRNAFKEERHSNLARFESMVNWRCD